MIDSLRGTLLEKTPDAAVVECAGVGYRVQIPTTTAGALPAVGESCRVYTDFRITENDVALYGFSKKAERDAFRMMTAVSGVGPKAGLAILSVMTPERIALAAAGGDHKAFTAAPGVGPICVCCVPRVWVFCSGFRGLRIFGGKPRGRGGGFLFLGPIHKESLSCL